MIIHLCFDTYKQAKEAHATIMEGSGVYRAYHLHGSERVDFRDGTSIRFHAKTKNHPPRGIRCACIPGGSAQ